jgi:hypothetical protein
MPNLSSTLAANPKDDRDYFLCIRGVASRGSSNDCGMAIEVE